VRADYDRHAGILRSFPVRDLIFSLSSALSVVLTGETDPSKERSGSFGHARSFAACSAVNARKLFSRRTFLPTRSLIRGSSMKSSLAADRALSFCRLRIPSVKFLE